MEDIMINSEVPKDLEEAAEAFAFKSLDEVILYGCTLSGRRACFIAGAKWQEEQDLKYISEIHRNGYNLCKEQMMKDAVEGRIEYVNGFATLDNVVLHPRDYKNGQKVRIIIVKE